MIALQVTSFLTFRIQLFVVYPRSAVFKRYSEYLSIRSCEVFYFTHTVKPVPSHVKEFFTLQLDFIVSLSDSACSFDQLLA